MTVTLINRVYYEENEILVPNVTSRLRKFMQNAYFREAISKVKRNFDRSINIFRQIEASQKLFSILLSHSWTYFSYSSAYRSCLNFRNLVINIP